jgi:hypothetical protein
MLLLLGICGPPTQSIALIMTEEFAADLSSFRYETQSPLVIVI